MARFAVPLRRVPRVVRFSAGVVIALMAILVAHLAVTPAVNAAGYSYDAPPVLSQPVAPASPSVSVSTTPTVGSSLATIAGLTDLSMFGSATRSSSRFVTATEDTGDAGDYIYRGVSEDHPGYEDALNGTATPRGGPAGAAEHNLGNTESPFTSWSSDESVARNFAGKNGVVMQIPNADGAGYTLVRSPDIFDENEVLARGQVTGAKVSP